jgi:hypothetical protein
VETLGALDDADRLELGVAVTEIDDVLATVALGNWAINSAKPTRGQMVRWTIQRKRDQQEKQEDRQWQLVGVQRSNHRLQQDS